jgi:hypothetical protein
MSRLKRIYARGKSIAKKAVVGTGLVLTGSSPAWAAFTIDTTAAVTDVTAAGTAILAVSVTIFGVKKIRQIVKA